MDVVYAKANGFVMTPDGGRFTVYGGQHWPADDPVVLAQPSLFTSDPRCGLTFSAAPKESDPPVERVTAAPGEKRGAVRRG